MILGTYNMPRYAMNNRREVESSTLAGCFYCLATFKPEEVKDYTDGDKTCICPRCGIDAVVGNMGLDGEVTEAKLRSAQFYWFKKKD
jgi:hypothetical protein